MLLREMNKDVSTGAIHANVLLESGAVPEGIQSDAVRENTFNSAKKKRAIPASREESNYTHHQH